MLSQNNQAEDKFNSLIEGLEELNSKEDMSDITQKCLHGLKKMKLARRFSQIDDEIFSLGLSKIEGNKTDFFTELLYLETKRLKFKEESSKCLQNQKAIKIQMTSK